MANTVLNILFGRTFMKLQIELENSKFNNLQVCSQTKMIQLKPKQACKFNTKHKQITLRKSASPRADYCSFGQQVHIPSFAYQQQRRLMRRLGREYCTSANYLHLRVMEGWVQKKKNTRAYIQGKDIEYLCENVERLQKYYHHRDVQTELSQILEYYKYYTQTAVCYLNQQFEFLSRHHQKKKIVLYQQLKKQLNLSDTQKQPVQEEKRPLLLLPTNVLKGLSITQDNNDESYLVNEMLKKLTGLSKPVPLQSLETIDQEFQLTDRYRKKNKVSTTMIVNSRFFHIICKRSKIEQQSKYSGQQFKEINSSSFRQLLMVKLDSRPLKIGELKLHQKITSIAQEINLIYSKFESKYILQLI